MIKETVNVELAGRTTFGIPARCARLVEYTDARADIPALQLEGKWKHIGSGANLLFTGYYDGTILASADSTLEFNDLGDDSVEVHAANGCVLDDIAAESSAKGLWGLENLSGIPGTVGGTVVQNVGAYGAELADTLVAVEVYDTATGLFDTIAAADCDLGYRHSRFKTPESASRYIIVGATFRLRRDAEPRLGYGALRQAVDDAAAGAAVTPLTVRRAVLDMRASKLPEVGAVGSAGSFFKNPEIESSQYGRLKADYPDIPGYNLPDGRVKVPAAWLIDRCGWKGRRIGGAAVWQKQPLVLVNIDGTATAADVIALQQAIRDDVALRFGVQLTPEVEFV